MNARWKFQIVTKEYARRTVRKPNSHLPLEIVADENEVLRVAREVLSQQSDGEYTRMDIESVGPLPVPPAENPPGWVITIIRQRDDGKGWDIEEGELQHGGWHPNLLNAIDYAAFRTRGRLAQFRMYDRHDSLIQIMLVDQRGWKDGLKFPEPGPISQG